MKALLQRVIKASVTIDGKEKREIGKGLVVFIAFGKSDDEKICEKMFEKIINLRIFSNAEGKFDFSIADIKGDLLIISQFTLYANTNKGKRPEFSDAAPYKTAQTLYDVFIKTAQSSPQTLKIQTGNFGSTMQVEIHNDGPVTIMIEE
jgi:D-tyrosyl-tRNA(Tyr) deacylase